MDIEAPRQADTQREPSLGGDESPDTDASVRRCHGAHVGYAGMPVRPKDSALRKKGKVVAHGCKLPCCPTNRFAGRTGLFRIHSPSMKLLPAVRLLVASIVSLVSLASLRAAERPNIIFIFSDDHAQHAISSYGSKVNKTPNIDR